MLKKIEDVEKSVETKSYLSALALALILPDICGTVAYPELKGNGERYAKWFDEHITKYEYSDDFEKHLKFDGKKCWKLRCAFLHAGNTDRIPDVDEFELSITECSIPGIYGASCYSITQSDNKPAVYRIRLDVAQLCFQLCSCARVFYEGYTDKSKFAEHKLTILDIGAEAKKIRDLNRHLYE